MHFIIFVYFPVFLCAQPHVNLNGCVRACTCGDEDDVGDGGGVYGVMGG